MYYDAGSLHEEAPCAGKNECFVKALGSAGLTLVMLSSSRGTMHRNASTTRPGHSL
jgi:hypothetical protein